jgi:3-phosphoshikimate 1-carboxyvinyltransferase
MASLAAGRSIIFNPLYSRDTIATLEACSAFGATIRKGERRLDVLGTRPKTPEDVINVQNSGSTLRFMTSVMSLPRTGFSVLTGDASIRRRPMQPLLDALKELGVQAFSSRDNGSAPIIVKGGGMKGGLANVNGDVSSQFVSSLLISAPLADKDVEIVLKDAISKPYIEATLASLSKFGIRVKREGYSRFFIESEQEYGACDFTIPGDFSSAAFVAAAVALVGGRVVLEGVDYTLPQGDMAIVDVLRSMGVKVRVESNRIIVESDGAVLQGVDVNLEDTPDLLPVVAALALKCDRTVNISGVAHARFKETDRISVLASELKKLEVAVHERRDGVSIKPGKLKIATLDAHGDHRMFMAFSLISMLLPNGLPMIGSDSLDVSYPSFLKDLERLGAEVRVVAG